MLLSASGTSICVETFNETTQIKNKGNIGIKGFPKL